jgi:hypothetical protein
MPSHRAEAVMVALLVVGLTCTRTVAQETPGPDTSATDALLDQARKANVLTTPGAPPFHAVLDITSETDDDTAHQGSIDLVWADPTHYRLQIQSPGFRQLIIVKDESVEETDDGDFYPTWLQNFVNALVNPLALADRIRGHNDFQDNNHYADFCIVRDDRRNNVLDAAGFARICFDKSLHMQLIQVLDFTHSLIFHDFQPFHDKSIAHSYRSSTRDGVDLSGTLRTLDDWRPDPSVLAITAVTQTSARILTTFVPSSTADTMVQSAPHDPHWPAVREGRLEGNMVLHVVTDRAGRVKEASSYESDNEELRFYGRELALQYQFKPLLVDGAPIQMETPLIIHFKTTLGTAIPEVDDAWLRSNTHCKLPNTVNRPASADKQVDITLRILANGKISGVQGADLELASSLMKNTCKFPTVLQNGEPSDYLAHLKVIAH